MGGKWIDAEFEVVSAPMRPGDPHPTRKGWRFVAADPVSGMTYWYTPPRFTRWQLFLLLVLVVPVAIVALSYGTELLEHYWPR